MKTTISLIIITICAACTNPPQPQQEKVGKEQPISVIQSPVNYDACEGTYAGNFGNSGEITLVLTHAGTDSCTGYSEHKGLRRKVEGTMREDRAGFQFVMREPGDSPYDGLFEFVIDSSAQRLMGSWTPLNDTKLSTTTFTLKRK